MQFPPTYSLLLDHHIIAYADGIDANVMKFKGPLCTTKEDCTDIIKAMDSVLTKLTAWEKLEIRFYYLSHDGYLHDFGVYKTIIFTALQYNY